jgi:hypothetical protein
MGHLPERTEFIYPMPPSMRRLAGKHVADLELMQPLLKLLMFP